MFYLVDSDLYPVWLSPVDRDTADEWIAKGEAYDALPASVFRLSYAIRHNQPARWYVFPR